MVWFAVAGFGFAALFVYVFTRWILSGPEPTTIGRSEVPDYMKVAAIVLQIGAPAVALALLWFKLIKPWRRDGRPSIDGLIMVALLSLLWQDSSSNYVQNMYTYNSYYVNFGSWNNYIPGWVGPGQDEFTEPFLLTGTFYIVFAFGGMLVANLAMRRAKARWPRIGVAGLVGVAFVSLAVLDLVAEPWFLVVGAWIYPSAHPDFSLFHGNYYQFPLWEPVLWGAAWTGLAVLRYFKNDRGESLCERGISDVRVGERAKSWIRIFAMVGAMNLSYLLLCNVPYGWIDLHQSPWPKDVTSRPYFVQKQCGPHAGFACPGGSTPVYKREGDYITNRNTVGSGVTR